MDTRDSTLPTTPPPTPASPIAPVTSMAVCAMTVDSDAGRKRQARMQRQNAADGFQLGWPLIFRSGPKPGSPEVDALAFGRRALAYWASETPVRLAHLVGVRSCLESFVRSGAEYMLLLEDDASWCRGFATILPECIAVWRRTFPTSHVLRVGYLPYANADQPWPPSGLCVTVSDGGLVSGNPERHTIRCDVADKVVGMQATVFDRAGGEALAVLLRGTADDIRARLSAIPAPLYSDGWPMIADHLLNLPQLHQALVVPPLVRETLETESTADSQPAAHKWGLAQSAGFLPPVNFFGSALGSSSA